jgi:2-succinyl-6-hydroxy-2,4-cyclohexadiene-1-carboxylate synthase
MFIETNGLKLDVDLHGLDPSELRNPLVFLHGMTLSGRDWKPVVETIADPWNPVTVDLVGHGKSDAPESRESYRIDSVVAQLSAILDELGLETARWCGYSMGGRILLQFAVRNPERVEAMILESTTPGIESSQEREKRRRKDRKLAEFLESQGLESFVKRWMDAPIFDSQESVSAQKRERARQLRLKNDPEGLKNCLRELGRGTVPHVWDCLDDLAMPVRLLTGELDSKHRKIHNRMHERLPNSSGNVFDDVGHDVHFEAPERFVQDCSTFLARSQQGRDHVD